MTGNAGERLFQAMEQISDEMILEAAQEYADAPASEEERSSDTDVSVHTDADFQVAGKVRNKLPYKKAVMEKLGGYLKYLPVAVCLCIVFGSTGYIINNYMHEDSSKSINQESGSDGSAEGAYDDAGDTAMKEEYESAGALDQKDDQTQNAAPSKQRDWLPVRYDSYEGPVFPLTATGDTQKLKVSRRLDGAVSTQSNENGGTALLQLKDTYKIKNTSKHDKTLQILYPFVTTLNGVDEVAAPILQIKGQDDITTAYSVGESIHAYRDADPEETSSLQDYVRIFNEQTEYQEQALAKEADWNKNVSVYTFSETAMQEQGVVGITVSDADADVLTYGFDHSFTNEDGSTTYCFFASPERKKRMLIVTGEQTTKPQPGYYTNLDCEESIDELQYEMSRQEMAYTDALRLCGNDAVRNLRKNYEQEMAEDNLAEYVNEDAAFRVLTMIGEEDTFYDTCRQRYQNTELTEIFERLFGETRVVYARATITVPAKQIVKVIIRTQKRRSQAPDRPDEAADMDVTYDFISDEQSHLPIGRTAVTLRCEGAWQLKEQTMGLRETQNHIWKTDKPEQNSSVTFSCQ